MLGETTTLSQADTQAELDYWELTRHPLPSLVFLLPLLFAYEIGVILISGIQGEMVRNGADHWMREGLLSLGIQSTFVLPSLLVAGLAIWHGLGQYPRKVSVDLVSGMIGESMLFAILLIVIGQVQDVLFHRLGDSFVLGISSSETIRSAVGYLGAGIYEEVLFRGILCTLIVGAGLTLKFSPAMSLTVGIVLSSLIFSTAHYIGPAADVYTHFSFVFRFLAGVYFAGLFAFRGLGIAIGAHALYDLAVGILLPSLA